MASSLNAWVTSAASEEEVNKALILAGSLRRVITSMKLVVVVTKSSRLSNDSRKKLRRGFDLVTEIQGDILETSSNTDAQLMLCVSSLSVFKRVVYISPNMMVLRNCDEIFDMDPEGYKTSSIYNNKKNCDEMKLQIYAISPSKEFHEKLQNSLEQHDATTTGANSHADLIIELATRNDSGGEIGLLRGKYNHTICLGGDLKLCVMNENVSIIRFVGGHPYDLWTKKGANLCEDFPVVSSLERQVVSCFLSIISLDNNSLNNKQSHYLLQSTPTPAPPPVYENEPVAIVGLSLRLPGANTADEFWNLLIEGRDVISHPPENRWTLRQTGKNWRNEVSSRAKAGFLTVPIDEFDAKFFGISPAEAVVMDPQVRLLHEVAWEALEDAGIDPLSLVGSRTGIFVGGWSHDYEDLVKSTNNYTYTKCYMGNGSAMQSARLSRLVGSVGPSISTETGCSSSMLALHLATTSLRNRESSMALACGVNLLISPFDSEFMGEILSPTYSCKTFDASADGFVRAEAVVVLALKRLSDALKDEDNIWGLVRGTGVAQEGNSSRSGGGGGCVGTPTAACESLAMEAALQNAGVRKEEVSYIEMHGTGTPVGDPVEVDAVTRAYSSPERHTTTAPPPLVIGSVKTNIGHTESASGIVGIIKVLLSMKYGKIPPHLHLEQLNSAIDLTVLPAVVPTQVLPWNDAANAKSGSSSRIAGVSSFGFSGTACHVIIEKRAKAQIILPNPKTKTNNNYLLPRRPLHILKISAKSPESFQLLVEKYEQMLRTTQHSFEDICYSANTGRATFSFGNRAVVVAENCLQAAELLRRKSFQKGEVLSSSASSSTSTGLCFLFTGQGSQYPGMASTLYSTSPLFRTHFEHASSILKQKYNISIADVMWDDGSISTDNDNTINLNRTLFSQTSIFCVEYSLLKLWESWGVKPDYVLGHSLGEFAAAVAAGLLDFEDALMLVAERSRLIEDHLPPGSMLVVKANKTVVDSTMADFKDSKKCPLFWADYAALNSDDQTVVAGEPEMVEKFAKYCAQVGLKSTVLASSHAFHSRHMDPILDSFRRIASTVNVQSSETDKFLKQNYPKYISGVDGRIVSREEIIGVADYWTRHARESVNFIDACKTAQKEGCRLFLELGPHPILSALLMKNLEEDMTMATSHPHHRLTCLPSLKRNVDDWSVMLDSLGKLFLSNWSGVIDWKGFDLGYPPRTRVPGLPFYPFNNKSIWLNGVRRVVQQQPVLHPLLGRPIPINSSNQFIFQNDEFLLNKQAAPYVLDHVIGNSVIVPGAVYIEMVLCAGFFSSTRRVKHNFNLLFHQPRRPVALRGLKITSPLALHQDSSTPCRLQIDVANSSAGKGDDDDDGKLFVSVSRYITSKSGDGDDDHWISHATAQFLPNVLLCEGEISHLTGQVDLAGFKDKSKPWGVGSQEFYQNYLRQAGVKLGPALQNLESGWEAADESGRSILFKVKAKTQGESLQTTTPNGVVDPILVDAMMQGMIYYVHQAQQQNGNNNIPLPVSIGDFIWLGRSSANSERYIYCSTSTGGAEGKVWCRLLDGEGYSLALLGSVEFINTSAKVVESMIYQQIVPLPKTWGEVLLKTKPISGGNPERRTEVVLEETPAEYSWVVFGNDDQGEGALALLTNELELKLGRANRKVYLYPEEPPFTSTADLSQSCEKDFKNDVKQLIQAAIANEKLEGIIYLWGVMRGEESRRNHQVDISFPYVTVCQVLYELEQVQCKIVAVTEGAYNYNAADDDDDESSDTVINPSAGVFPGLVRAIENEVGLRTCQMDLSCRDPPSLQSDHIVSNLWTTDETETRPVLVFRGDQTLQPKLVPCKVQNSYLSLPNPSCTRFQLVLPPASKLASDLEFTTYFENQSLAEDEIEIEVKAVALNCQNVTGFESFNMLGLDVAGVVTKIGVTKVGNNTKVGDRIAFTSTGQPMSSHRKVKACLGVAIPKNMTFAQGATLPSAFYTAYHALVRLARMSRGETVLVHTACGGVGLVAIQLARQVGAVVIATAGSQRKRAYLRNVLGIKHVFNSETLEFGKQVLAVTDGVGVNIVLNSLTGQGFKEKSLGALGRNGRFVELSSLVEDAWSPEEVKRFRPDVNYYTIADLTTMEDLKHAELSQILENYLAEELIQPIPYDRFDALNIRGALDHLQKGNHMGKVVCIMPESRNNRTTTSEHVNNNNMMTPTFNENSTYLVTGGLTGVGFEIVKWILASGGKHVAIAGRRPPTPEVAEKIKSWNSSGSGKHVQAFQVDVGDLAQCSNLFETLSQAELGFPPVRGLMHAAGVYSPGILENQNWERFRSVYNPKVSGSWNLHELTKGLLLEHFVLFSSFASLFGGPGQTNYSGACSFQDALAQYRHSVGLPALSVNWGNWGEAGFAAGMDIPGFRPMTTAQATGALDLLLRTGTISQKTSSAAAAANTLVANIDSYQLLLTRHPNVKHYIDDKQLLLQSKSAAPAATTTTLLGGDQFWTELSSSCLSREGKLARLKQLVKTTIRNILGLDAHEGIEDNEELTSLGVDSLMTIELKNGLHQIIGGGTTTVPVPIITTSDLKDCTTPLDVATLLLNLFLEEGNAASKKGESVEPRRLPSPDELRVLIREDSILPENITPAASSSSAPIKPLDQVETVLLTGVTGSLGPYLLVELCKRERVSKVICLVRKKRHQQLPSERLKATLEKFELSKDIDMGKVELVQGNLSEPRFGMSESEYHFLCSSVDAVVHSAAWVDHTAKYWKAAPDDSNRNNIRGVNVLGTRQILHLCTTLRPKHLYYASTIVAIVPNVEEGGGGGCCLSEDWQDVGAFDSMGFNRGYTLSKHVCEQLVRQAGERGLPVKTFRLPLVAGESSRGLCDPTRNHLVLRWLAALKLGVIPDFRFPLPAIPVDILAEKTLTIFFNPGGAKSSDVYNVCHRNPGDDLDIVVDIAKQEFGIEVKVVPYQSFMKLLVEDDDDDTCPLAPFRSLYKEDVFGENVLQSFKWVQKEDLEQRKTTLSFATRKVNEILPGFEESLEPCHVVIRRDLRYLRDSGIFAKFGIQTNL